MPPKKRASARGAGDAPATKKSKDTDVEIQGRTVRWEWEGDGGKWMQYSKEHSLALTDALSKGKNQINIPVAPKVTMLLQLKDMVQKNKKTGFERRLRMAIKDSKDDEFYIWQWQDEKGRLNPYSATISLELEDAVESNTPTVTFEACHRSYSIDMKKMKQINTLTSVVRDVERSKSEAEASAEDGDGPSTSSTSVIVKKEEEEEEEEAPKKRRGRGSASVVVKKEEEEEEEAPKKGRGRGSAGKSAAKSGRGKKGTENGEPETKSVVRQVTVAKGSAPVDAECPLESKCKVHESSGIIWDCMLNQTNVGNNNNKYFIIQLLEESGKKSYHVWMRWGRVGYKGQNNLMSPGGDLDKAKQIFSKKFQDKTKNDWSQKDSFVKVPGKYDMVHLDYSAKEEDQVDAGASGDAGDSQVPDSKLEKKTQDLINLICDVKSMEEAVVEMKYDAKKAPLGKLTTVYIVADF
ncbi:hypothetical protein V1264_000374 [Littorina saxatilis]|uniref:NAD(+) ADP-ribosyltransferase n=1 Tax=Littorina saxatilis TaxID=31220 RepID=A0AAN9BZ85_9CAEN